MYLWLMNFSPCSPSFMNVSVRSYCEDRRPTLWPLMHTCESHKSIEKVSLCTWTHRTFHSVSLQKNLDPNLLAHSLSRKRSEPLPTDLPSPQPRGYIHSSN